MDQNESHVVRRLLFGRSARRSEMQAWMDAINRVQAVIQFKLDGTILAANENFLKTMGYSLDEIRGQHHSIFVEPADRDTPAYRTFWQKLGRGELDAGRYKRIARGGREVWIQASYNPIFDSRGRPHKVVKLATDITEEIRREEASLRRARLVQALDNVSANVMVADADHNIIYMNKTVERMFQAAESDIRKDLPSFRSERLMGANIDVFHRHRAHQREMLTRLSGTAESHISLGGRTFRIVANPVVDERGQRVGTVVEWADRTQELGVEAEVNSIVENALKGDLTRRIHMEGKTGFFGKLSEGVNRLLESFVGVVQEIREASEQVRIGVEEISKGNSSLSQRTEEQATSLEETAASMQEMTSTVKQTADNAAHANQLAIAARERAERGGGVMSAAVAAMTDIRQSSHKISEIIGVIDEIAFQTNLLALNAAVEAARAGEQGRGFAVVAAEVRNLSGRSASAAKEIKALIRDSVDKVEQGTELVDHSGKVLSEIVTAVKKVTDIVAEIAAASREQHSGIAQVNKAVGQMDEGIQQNAALVEQAAAASEAIAAQAQSLHKLISHFIVGSEAPARELAPAEPRAAAAVAVAERRGPDRPWAGAVERLSADRGQKRAAVAHAPVANDEWEEM